MGEGKNTYQTQAALSPPPPPNIGYELTRQPITSHPACQGAKQMGTLKGGGAAYVPHLVLLHILLFANHKVPPQLCLGLLHQNYSLRTAPKGGLVNSLRWFKECIMHSTYGSSTFRKSLSSLLVPALLNE